METPKQGKTLWEMLQARLHGSGGSNGPGIAFGNSLDLRVGSPVAVAYSNGPEFADYNFTVQEIREYTRRIGGPEFWFTHYALRGVNTKYFDSENVMPARLRV